MVKKKISEIRKIICNYISVLEKENISIERVILYGSYASGTARPDSDIDLVVISRDFDAIPVIDRLQLLSRLTLRVGAPLEVLGYSPKEIRASKKNSIFWEEITSTGREIYRRAA